jgi:hypothetical protein
MLGSRKRKKAEGLIQTGGRGVGTIVGIRDTGMTINDNPRIVMVFQIEPLDGSAPFQAEKKATVSRVAIPVPGMRFPVYYDREDPSEFIFVAAVDGPDGAANLVNDFGDAFGADASGIGMPAAQAAPPAAPPAVDVVAQLERLAALRSTGVLSDTEFAEQKQRILAG